MSTEIDGRLRRGKDATGGVSMFCVDFAGYEGMYGGNAQPKSDSPLKSGLAIRAPALAPGLGRTPKASVTILTVGVKELTVYLKGDSVNRLTVRQKIDGGCQDIDGGG